jgi:hypothetical protein
LYSWMRFTGSRSRGMNKAWGVLVLNVIHPILFWVRALDPKIQDEDIWEPFGGTGCLRNKKNLLINLASG